MPSEASPSELAKLVLEGDRSAVSTALNLVDDDRPTRRKRALELLDALEGRGHGARIGVTGAPGSGKSTLLDAMVSGLRRRGRSVGILAVDPSSQRTRGALLGDRMRLGSSTRDAGVFLRSMAARDRLGGLSEVTGPSLDVLVARNVSQTGIGVYVSHDFAGCDLDKQVELVITLPGEHPYLARGLIKHRTDGGREGHHFGLHFTTITRENRAKVRAYVRFTSTN